MDDARFDALATPRSRRVMARLVGGLAVGGALSALGVAEAADVSGEQTGWRYCRKCGGPWFANSGLPSVCPAGHQHSKTGSGQYSLYYDFPPNADFQDNWRYSGKCRGMWWAGNASGVCPKGGGHRLGTANYLLEHHHPTNPPNSLQQAGWRDCCKCDGLFYSVNGPGVCPKGRGHNDKGSGNYSVNYTP